MSDKQTAAMLDKKLDENTAQARRGFGRLDAAENADRRSLALAGIIRYTFSESEGSIFR